MNEPTVLQFLGGAGTVTGSRFLFDSAKSKVLVDAGMFQGRRRHRRKNWDPFPVDPAALDAVVLTHAHIDHSGYLPRLVKQGFAGPVFCTERTAELCQILLPDAAHLQEEEARYANKHRYSKHNPAAALFSAADAEAALALLRPIPFGESTVVTKTVTIELSPAGHILGSASVLLKFGGGSSVRSILVSGDIGRGDHPLLVAPQKPPDADVVLIESTYGNRRHPDPKPEIDALVDTITTCTERGGMVVIPAFSVDRTEVLLMLLAKLMETNRIPRVPIYVDSPMALRVLKVYRSAVAAGDPDIRPGATLPTFESGIAINECQSVDQSKALADLAHPSIIISASGMATGGRVLHHLARLLPDERNAVVLSGFQAVGTRGRALADGAQVLKMLGRYIPVCAQVVGLESLSAHADSDDLVAWIRGASRPPAVVYAVHGESEAAEALCGRLGDQTDVLAVVAREGERVRLD